MAEEKTHRKKNTAAVSARHLADYMVASEQRRRTIERECKFQPAARLPQHKEAKIAVVSFLRGSVGLQGLLAKGKELRTRAAEDSFQRDLFDNNAEYIERFVAVSGKVQLPKRAAALAVGPPVAATLNGVKVTIDGAVRLQRTTAGRVCGGIATLRYQKGKELSEDVGKWQSALMWGILDELDSADNIADRKLVLTLDAYSGSAYAAPGNAKDRFKNMRAACQSIAERWDNIQPPPNAVL